MPDVKVNVFKNRLYISIEDRDQTNMFTYVQNIESACRVLSSGFSCLMVLRKNGLIHQKDKDLLFSTTDLISAYGAGKVVYVKKPNDNSSASWLRRFYIQPFIPVEIASNIEEAEDILDCRKSEFRFSRALSA
ncbi:MAG TPA: hypothetical protein VMW06_00665 [Desulfobacterales bacterium]|nr:hypothetical protein [Desulfobacterales bacterium]